MVYSKLQFKSVGMLYHISEDTYLKIIMDDVAIYVCTNY